MGEGWISEGDELTAGEHEDSPYICVCVYICKSSPGKFIGFILLRETNQ